MKIKKAFAAYESEKFKQAFGFKGNALTGVWQTVVCLSDGDTSGVGLGVQSVLWADAGVFSAYGEEKSNALMYAVTKYAIKIIEGKEYNTPSEMIKSIFSDVYTYAKTILNNNVSKTFVLNALVPLDMAAWSLWAKETGAVGFDEIYKGTYKAAKLANIPLITYKTSAEEIKKAADNGTCIFKIKIGSDPYNNNDAAAMLEWDKKRALDIHNLLKDRYFENTESNRALYYFDANGRYDSKERLLDLIEFLDRKEILKQTVLFEEPFNEDKKIYLGDIPVAFSADESVHSSEDATERISLGYSALTLKPIAKTVSVSIDMAEIARKNNIHCFCADLTVNPAMVEWNKNFAARLAPLPGMKIGVVESNGAQNYINWERMKSYMYPGYPFEDTAIYNLGEKFYKESYKIFDAPKHYKELIKEQNL